MRKYRYLLTIVVALMIYGSFLSGCVNDRKPSEATLIVSIAPLKYIVEAITCRDFPVEVLVPEGSSPETYSPTPLQISHIETSPIIFVTGLIDFETELAQRLTNNTRGSTRFADLSKGITLIEGTCSHNHNNISVHPHNHGIDPHIWVSPKQLKIMSENAYNAISAIFPDSTKYHGAYLELLGNIDQVSEYVEQTINNNAITHFFIYHPALTYYANDYGLEQIALEEEGKEPSLSHMKNIVNSAKYHDLKYIMIQREFPRSAVEAIAHDIGAEIVVINPLSEDILHELIAITNVINSDITCINKKNTNE